ncbi:MAG: tRNA pseudouridine(38-40) synthase TruA [Clostridiales bacterium]|nr:tRNA pseudouridine(38-40) synthase TruA [Clostridiales bacterium]
MMKILLELSYIGTNYAGFQVQPNKATVQSAIQDALERVYGERLPVKGCSRTDSGVHALQYFATYDTARAIPTERIPLALNSALPADIAVRSARIVPDSFHVRHDVLRKEYEYRLLNSRIRDPFLEGRVYRIPHILGEHEISLMQCAAKAFVGEHDFSGFMSAGSSVADTVRRVDWLDVIVDDNLIKIRVAANGFLYNMVRIIVGTLLDTAHGRIAADDMAAIIALCDRSRAGFTAPPEGLYLRRVEYGDFAAEQ